MKRPQGELTIKFVLYCIVMYCNVWQKPKGKIGRNLSTRGLHIMLAKEFASGISWVSQWTFSPKLIFFQTNIKCFLRGDKMGHDKLNSRWMTWKNMAWTDHYVLSGRATHGTQNKTRTTWNAIWNTRWNTKGNNSMRNVKWRTRCNAKGHNRSNAKWTTHGTRRNVKQLEHKGNAKNGTKWEWERNRKGKYWTGWHPREPMRAPISFNQATGYINKFEILSELAFLTFLITLSRGQTVLNMPDVIQDSLQLLVGFNCVDSKTFIYIKIQ